MQKPSIPNNAASSSPLFQQRQQESVEHAPRIARLLDRVRALMRDGRPRTLRQIADACGGSEAGVGARLRELRSQGWTVDKVHHGGGLYLYTLTGGPA